MIHVLDVSGMEGRDPIEDYEKINAELAKYSEKLSRKLQIVAANKIDLLTDDSDNLERSWTTWRPRHRSLSYLRRKRRRHG